MTGCRALQVSDLGVPSGRVRPSAVHGPMVVWDRREAAVGRTASGRAQTEAERDGDGESCRGEGPRWRLGLVSCCLQVCSFVVVVVTLDSQPAACWMSAATAAGCET